jgi:hypothetical protein
LFKKDLLTESVLYIFLQMLVWAEPWIWENYGEKINKNGFFIYLLALYSYRICSLFFISVVSYSVCNILIIINQAFVIFFRKRNPYIGKVSFLMQARKWRSAWSCTSTWTVSLFPLDFEVIQA